MRNHVLAATLATLFSCTAGSPAAQAGREPDKLERASNPLAGPIADSMRNAELYDTNGFRVASSNNAQLGADLKPDGNRFDLLRVDASGVFQVALEKGRPNSAGGGLGIFHRDSGAPILSVADADGDGGLDGLTYAKVDEHGNTILSVTDYEADGQPDMRIHFADHYVELWHADRWHRVENREGRRGIVLNGAFVELQQEGNRLSVP